MRRQRRHAQRFSDSKGHVFVASFIAEAMNGLFDEIDRTIVLVRILSEENEEKWGISPPGAYHRDEFRVFHVDSDDTAYEFHSDERDIWRAHDTHRAYVSARCTIALRRAAGQLAAFP